MMLNENTWAVLFLVVLLGEVGKVFLSLFDNLQNCILFLSVCQPALTSCYRGIERKAPKAGFSVLCYTNKVSIRLRLWICATSTVSWIYEMLLFDDDRYCAFWISTDCLINQLLKCFRLLYSRITQFYFEGTKVNICTVAPVEWKKSG